MSHIDEVNKAVEIATSQLPRSPIAEGKEATRQDGDKGLRYNVGKTRHDLVPPFAQEQYARVLTKGAEKYADRNWEQGMKWSKVIESLKRHTLAFERGEDYDPETGLLHTAHIMCNAAFLTEYYKIFPQGDNRPHKYLDTPHIGLDIDEVVADFVGAWQAKYGKHNIIDDRPTAWNYDYAMKDRFANMQPGELEEFYWNLNPKISPSEIPFEPCCYVTSRPIPSDLTKQWLQHHGFPTSEVITVPFGTSKVNALKDSKAEIFVDDSFTNFVQLNNAGICTFLMDAPHNQRYDVGYKRIKSLKELV